MVFGVPKFTLEARNNCALHYIGQSITSLAIKTFGNSNAIGNNRLELSMCQSLLCDVEVGQNGGELLKAGRVARDSQARVQRPREVVVLDALQTNMGVCVHAN